MSAQKASKEDEQKRGQEKANIFENRFRSGGEENKRQMANNVIQEMRVKYCKIVDRELI